MHIVSTFYISKYSSDLDVSRSKELEECLTKNLENPDVDKIHLFLDDDDALNRLNEISGFSEKIVVACIGIKPKYDDFFRYIIDNLHGQICMITNADIYLYECEYRLIESVKTEKICYSLSRHEHDLSHPQIDQYYGSHDCYIFNSLFIDEKIINAHTNFHQNCPGIESQIVKNFCDHGFKVYNPCKQIKIVHLHKTQLRNQGKWVGLHVCGDLYHQRSSCWWVPPILL